LAQVAKVEDIEMLRQTILGAGLKGKLEKQETFAATEQTIGRLPGLRVGQPIGQRLGNAQGERKGGS
jgi:hypothetical protein